MSRASDSIHIMYVVLKFFKFNNGEIFLRRICNQKLLKIRITFYSFINVSRLLHFMKNLYA